MSTSINKRDEAFRLRHTSDSAFPHTMTSPDSHAGMTRRQWYAGLAMQGILAASPRAFMTIVAKDAWAAADALLKAEHAP